MSLSLDCFLQLLRKKFSMHFCFLSYVFYFLPPDCQFKFRFTPCFTTPLSFVNIFLSWIDRPSGPMRPLWGFEIILRHTTLGRTLWTSEQPDAETSTWQNTTFVTDRHPWSRRDSIPPFQPESDRRPMSEIARSLGSVVSYIAITISNTSTLKKEVSVSCEVLPTRPFNL